MPATKAMSPRQTRSSRQRSAVLESLADVPDFRTVKEIHADLARRGHALGISTVYRHLAAMVAQGDVGARIGPDGETRFRRCSRVHHHHLVCRTCGLTVEVTGAGLEDWVADIAAAHGYSQVSHRLELSGCCASCRHSAPGVQGTGDPGCRGRKSGPAPG